jgi:hypothetical protein
MLEIVWPMLYLLSLVGFIYSAVLAGLPGGMQAITKFFINLVAISSYPIFYALGMKIIAQQMALKMTEHMTTIMLPWVRPEDIKGVLVSTGKSASTAGIDYALDINYYNIASAVKAYFVAHYELYSYSSSYLAFMTIFTFGLPMIVEKIVRSESLGMAASAIAYGARAEVMKVSQEQGGNVGQ